MNEVTLPRKAVEALYELYNAYWNQVCTLQSENDGESIITNDDIELLDEAAGKIEPFSDMIKSSLNESSKEDE